MPEYVYKPFEEVTALAHDVLTAMGADDGNAAVVAEHLALADASGMYTHGIVHLPGYLNAVRLGGILPTGRPRVMPSLPRKFQTKSTGGPEGRPLLNGTKTTL